MNLRAKAKRVVRSTLFHTPGVYEYVSAQRRFLWMDKLRMVNDRDLLALPGLLSKPRPMIIDVGANCGQTLLSVKRLFPRSHVVCFEPNPCSVAMLRRLHPRFPDLRIEAVGLGDHDDDADLFIPVYNGTVMSGLASFDYASAKTWLNRDTVLGFRAERLEIRVERAPIRKLDDYGLKPDLIKIDAQGFEDDVVNGGMQTIELNRPVALVENPSDELVSVFASLDYRAFECRRKQLVPATGTTTNQYFLPS